MPNKTWLLTYSLHRCEKKMTCFSFMTFLFWIKSSTFAVNCILFQALLFYKQLDTMKKKVFNIWKGIFCRFTMEHSNKYALCWIQKLDLFVTILLSVKLHDNTTTTLLTLLKTWRIFLTNNLLCCSIHSFICTLFNFHNKNWTFTKYIITQIL